MKILRVILIIGVYILTACEKKAKQPFYKNANKDWVWGKKDLSPTFTWLKQHKAYESQHFKDSFYMFYNIYLKNGHVDSVQYFIDWYSGQLNIRGNYDSTICATQIEFIKKYENSRDTNITYLMPVVAYHLSAQYDFKGELDSAIFWSNYVVKHPQAIPFTKTFSMQNIGDLLVRQGKLDKALPLFIDAGRFHHNRNNAIPESMSYAKIAKTYSDLGAYDEATQYYDKAISMMIKKDERPNQVDFYYEKIKMLYNDSKDTASVIVTADSLLACQQPILEKYFSKSKLYLYRINTGLYYKYECLNKPDSSYLHLQQCKNLVDSINNDDLKTDFTILTIQHELKYKRKISDEKKLITLTEKKAAANNFASAELLYGFLAENAVTNNPNKAIVYFNKQKEIKEKRLALNNKGKLFELAEKYEAEKKEQQILLQKEALRGKNKTIGLLVFSLGFIALMVLAFRYYQSRKKLKKEKEMTDAYTKQLFDKTEEERKRIATDLHDSISHELMSLKNDTKEEFGQVNQKIDTIINDIRIISRNLHPVLFDKIGLQSTIEQMTERVQLQNGFMLTADINYNGNLASSTELQVYRILQEAITNMVKYADAVAGKITITEDETKVNIEIKDNGKGFNVTEALNSHKAFGIHNILERSKAIGGEAKIISGSSGTVINIVIPKNKI
jgi:two-component system, NarL family, sensor kinase